MTQHNKNGLKALGLLLLLYGLAAATGAIIGIWHNRQAAAKPRVKLANLVDGFFPGLLPLPNPVHSDGQIIPLQNEEWKPSSEPLCTI
jgi:hypothetical protein